MTFRGRINQAEDYGPVKIDMKDRKIMSVLAKNSRTPLSAIAKQVKLSRDAVDYRINRLFEKNVILGFAPLLHIRNFGYNRFHLFFLLDETKKERQHELIEYLKSHPNTRSVMEYSDRWDLEVVLLARGLLEFDSISTEIISKFSDVIREKSGLEVIKNYNSVHLPYKFYENMASPALTAEVKDELVEVDEKDLKILRLLSTDARMSTYKIGDEVGLSPDAVSYRIKKMVDTHLIIKFAMLVNLSMIKYQWYTFAMKMNALNAEHEMRFREFVKNHPYIIRAVKTLGEWDMLLYIVVDSQSAYHKTIMEIKHEFADIVTSYDSWVTYMEHIYNPYPLVLEQKVKQKKVLVFGSFDILHPGHISLFKEAKKYGDHLTVIVSRNKTIEKVKGTVPKYDENDRLEHVKELEVVDEAMLGNPGDKYKIIQDIKPDVICLGYDQHVFADELEIELKKRNLEFIKVIRLKPYKETQYKSSILKEEQG